MTCNCEICRHDYGRIGFKKYRKWHSKYVGKLKKRMHRLESEGIKFGDLCSDNPKEVEMAVLQVTFEEALLLYYEARNVKRYGNWRGKGE